MYFLQCCLLSYNYYLIPFCLYFCFIYVCIKYLIHSTSINPVLQSNCFRLTQGHGTKDIYPCIDYVDADIRFDTILS